MSFPLPGANWTYLHALTLKATTGVSGFPLQITPAGLTATAVASGGTFAAGTYYWKVTFVTAQGESPAGNEASAAIVLNGSCNLAWTAPPSNVTGVKVYRGTAAGAENVLVATLGAVAAYTDTGSAGTAGSPPATSSTPTILTWTAPDDGAKHRALVFGAVHITSPETGGAIQLHFVLDGATGTPTLQGGGTGSGVYQITGDPVLVDPGSTVTVVQSSALNAGAALLWAEIWAL